MSIDSSRLQADELVAQLSGNAECATLLDSKVRLPLNWNPPWTFLSDAGVAPIFL